MPIHRTNSQPLPDDESIDSNGRPSSAEDPISTINRRRPTGSPPKHSDTPLPFVASKKHPDELPLPDSINDNDRRPKVPGFNPPPPWFSCFNPRRPSFSAFNGHRPSLGDSSSAAPKLPPPTETPSLQLLQSRDDLPLPTQPQQRPPPPRVQDVVVNVNVARDEPPGYGVLILNEIKSWDNWVLFLPEAFFFFCQWAYSDPLRQQSGLVQALLICGFIIISVLLYVHSFCGIPLLREVLTMSGCFEAIAITANGLVACVLLGWKVQAIATLFTRAAFACVIRMLKRAAIKRWSTFPRLQEHA